MWVDDFVEVSDWSYFQCIRIALRGQACCLHLADGSEDLFVVYRGYCAPRHHHGSAPVPSPEMEVIVGEICARNALMIAIEGEKLL
jgi:hypothetical protein